jgi:hypothetical protein
LTMLDGSVMDHQQNDAKGDPELPMSQHDIEIKAHMLLQAAGAHNNGQLIAATLKLYDAKSLHAWTQLWP